MTGPPPPDHTSDLSSNIQTTASSAAQDASGRQPAAASSAASQLASAKISLRKTLRQFPDFPIPGIDFVDIMPLFANPEAHATLVSALELQISQTFNNVKPDIIVGLDARGFLFGPGLALRLGVGFAAVRKKGKLPGPCVTAEYVKEYGKDLFQMQEDAIKEGQKVLIVDDIIATGGSAKAAADLVTQLKGQVLGYLFILEIPGLNGRDKLGAAPTTILLEEA
ncbi:adenine phosphoribosyltransferase [Pochonia chlamydosporia 170]|uniref:adenine phosphoribosyltransferase n=1 Tax=Pochonia chlamydosporia 170 TaxID=1380566 RepID=A0A179FT58_METCM|nr:adenine phosphoribosyltransferase [Pochonia chlamydosporia 170]OAQ68390.1 adenine phosphoribosyltransferase [Pochonia chlamydosporia 170]